MTHFFFISRESRFKLSPSPPPPLPHVLRCGASVAPVVDWTLYDTFYTERYMGMLDDNRKAYNDSMVFWRLEPLR